MLLISIIILLFLRCFQLTVGQLILCKVLTQLVESIDSPKCELRDLNPSVVHCLGIHNDDDQMERILFKTSCEARTGSWGNSSFKAVESFAEELVGVGPEVLAWLIIDVFAFALVSALVHDVPHDWILHSDAGELANVSGGRFIVLMRKSMGVRKVGGLQA